MLKPTDEQTAAVDAFRAGQHLSLQAGAGTGKTSTLALLASVTQRHGRYIAFDRSIAHEARRRFPPSVTCKTAHALAYAAVGHRYSRRLNGPRRSGWRVGQDLGITRPRRLGSHELFPATLSHAVLRTVARYCHSADRTLMHHHVPRLRGLDTDQDHDRLAATVLPFARKAWADLQHLNQGAVRFEHDHYLKMWALTDPRIETDFLLLDEAQDTNPVLEEVLAAQRSHAQLVVVGDSAQAIYGWRGARDIMTSFDGTQLTLSQSFRFGPDLAGEANRWLAIAHAPLRLRGTTSLTSHLGTLATADAVLCRTNVGAMTEVMTHLSAGHRVALAGGGGSLRALAQAARDLQEGRRTPHPELTLFPSWAELQDYAAHDPAGRDLKPFVDLIDQYGTETVLAAVDRLAHDTHAEVTISTAHKAKGHEWANVRIAHDFPPPKDSGQRDEHDQPIHGPIDVADARLAYVAVTRARQCLDLGGLSWIHDHPEGRAGQ